MCLIIFVGLKVHELFFFIAVAYRVALIIIKLSNLAVKITSGLVVFLFLVVQTDITYAIGEAITKVVTHIGQGIKGFFKGSINGESPQRRG